MAIEIMRIQENRVFNTVANQLQIPANELLTLCLRSFLEQQLNLGLEIGTRNRGQTTFICFFNL
jgi:hypothetical protein